MRSTAEYGRLLTASFVVAIVVAIAARRHGSWHERVAERLGSAAVQFDPGSASVLLSRSRQVSSPPAVRIVGRTQQGQLGARATGWVRRVNATPGERS